ncbi:MAG: hypothetical protein ACKVLD_07420 [Flavobacteriales bacterium]
MINTLIAIKKEHQNEILFFLTETIQKKCFKNIIGFEFNRIGRKILSITFHLKENNKELEKEIEKEIEMFININISNNLHFENQEIKELFLDYKIGVIKCNRIDSSFALEQKMNLSNFSKTNIKILKELEESTDFYETLINRFIIFIYVIGGYSDKQVLKITTLLLNSLEFSKENLIALDSEILTIYKQEEKELVKNNKIAFQKLANKTVDGCVFSELKNSYRNLYHQNEDSQKLFQFSNFKNQVDISDSECYSILTIINKIAKEE